MTEDQEKNADVHWKMDPPRIVFVCEFNGMAVGFVVPPKNHVADGIEYHRIGLMAHVRYGEGVKHTLDAMIAVSADEFAELSTGEAAAVAEKVKEAATQHLQGKITLDEFHEITMQIRPFDYRR